MFSFIEKLVVIVLAVALLAACVFGTDLGLPLQSFAMIGLALAGVLAVFCCFVKMSLPAPYLLIGSVGTLLFLGIRAQYSPVVDFGLDDTFLILAAGVLYVVAGYLCASPTVRIGIAYVFLIGFVLNIGSAVMQANGGDGYWPLAWFAEVSRPKGSVITGMYGYRGSFANFAAMASMLSLSLALLGRYHAIIRVLLGTLAILGMVAVIMSSSRSAMISLVGGGGVFICLLWVTSAARVQKAQKYFRIMIFAIAALVLVGGPYAAYKVFSKRSSAEHVGGDVFFADSSRSGYWPMALSQVNERPWLGSGSRSFSYENYKHWNPNLKARSASPEFVHNEYLQAVTDYGLIGLLLILGVVSAHLAIGAKRTAGITVKMRSHGLVHSNELALCVAGVVGVSVMAIHSMFDFRMHLQSNLLLTTACLLWVLPVRRAIGNVQSDRQRNERTVGLAQGAWLVRSLLAVVVLSSALLAAFLGAKELRAGIPLLEAKLAVEKGSWNLGAVSKGRHVEALEASIQTSPSYRRHEKLGTIYHFQATKDGLAPDIRNDLFNKAFEQYTLAKKRHPHSPMVDANLGMISGEMGRYREADKHFESLLATAVGARGELLFGSSVRWSNVTYKEAIGYWEAKDHSSARSAFEKALAIMDDSMVHPLHKKRQKLLIAVGYIKFLIQRGDFEQANRLIAELELSETSHRGPFRKLDLGEYYYAEGMDLWSKRQPSQAMALFLKARRCYLMHKRELKGDVDSRWQSGYQLVEDRLAFFKETNISPATAE